MKKNKLIPVECPHCKREGNTLSKKTLNVRPIGYKDKLDFYIVCKHCGQEIVIPNNKIPFMLRIAIVRDMMKYY